MGKPQNFAGFTIYKIYYGEELVYVGRTMQPLQNRIRGHLFKKPMYRAIDINLVSKIEYALCKSEADMFLYEVYYINMEKPPLNVDDKAYDGLTVRLPELEWQTFVAKLWEKWKIELSQIEAEEKAEQERQLRRSRAIRELRQKYREGKISEEEYDDGLIALDEI